MDEIVTEDQGLCFQSCQELQAPESKMFGTRSLLDAASSGKCCEIDTFFGRDRAGVVGLSTNALPIRTISSLIRKKLCRVDSGFLRMRG